MAHFTRLALAVGVSSIALGSLSYGADLEIPGFGETGCDKIIEIGEADNKHKAERQELGSWAQGFLGGLMTAHAVQFAKSSNEAMGSAIAIDYDWRGDWGKLMAHCQQYMDHNIAQAVMALAAGLGVLQEEEPTVPGVYQLIEMNGAQLPAVSLVTNPNGKRCRKEVLQGALLLDNEGRSAAFITERNACLNDDGSQPEVNQKSVIFPGTYTVAGNRITIETDFGPDHAILNGDILMYMSDEEDQSTTAFTFRRE